MSQKRARPFLKWAGGKRWLVETLSPKLKPLNGTYFEPFLGAGAVFLAQVGAPRRVASDANHELVNAWNVIRNSLPELLSELSKFSNDKEQFLEVRSWDRQEDWQNDHSPAQRAARLIYLNKTCFNGLFRVNASGQFNVPFGNYKNPRILDVENLEAVRDNLLQGSVEIEVSDFEATSEKAKSGDVIYFDPPYAPLSETSSFVSYSETGFNLLDQARLRDVAVRAMDRGVLVVLSNSDVPSIRELYGIDQRFSLETVRASRAISASASGRAEVDELLIVGRP